MKKGKVRNLYPRDELIIAVDRAMETQAPEDLFLALIEVKNPTEYAYVQRCIDTRALFESFANGLESLSAPEQMRSFGRTAREVFSLLGTVEPGSSVPRDNETPVISGTISDTAERPEEVVEQAPGTYSEFERLGRELGSYYRYANNTLKEAGYPLLPTSAFDGLGLNEAIREKTGFDCFAALSDAIQRIDAALQHRSPPRTKVEVFRPGIATALVEFHRAMVNSANKIGEQADPLVFTALELLCINFSVATLLLGDVRGAQMVDPAGPAQAEAGDSESTSFDFPLSDEALTTLLPFCGNLDQGIRSLMASAATRLGTEDSLTAAQAFGPLLVTGFLKWLQADVEEENGENEKSEPSLIRAALDLLELNTDALELDALLELLHSIDPYEDELDSYLDDMLFATTFYFVQASCVSSVDTPPFRSFYDLGQFGRVMYFSGLRMPVWSIWQFAALMDADDVMIDVTRPERWDNYIRTITGLVESGHAALAEQVFSFYLCTQAGQLLAAPEEVLQRMNGFNLLGPMTELADVESKLRSAGRCGLIDLVVPVVTQALNDVGSGSTALAYLWWPPPVLTPAMAISKEKMRPPLDDFLNDQLEQIMGTQYKELPPSLRAQLLDAERVFLTSIAHGAHGAIWIGHYQTNVERLFAPVVDALWSIRAMKVEAISLLPELKHGKPRFSTILRLADKIVQTGNKLLLDHLASSGIDLGPLVREGLTKYMRENVLKLRNRALHEGDAEMKEAIAVRIWLLKHMPLISRCLPRNS